MTHHRTIDGVASCVATSRSRGGAVLAAVRQRTHRLAKQVRPVMLALCWAMLGLGCGTSPSGWQELCDGGPCGAASPDTAPDDTTADAIPETEPGDVPIDADSPDAPPPPLQPWDPTLPTPPGVEPVEGPDGILVGCRLANTDAPLRRWLQAGLWDEIVCEVQGPRESGAPFTRVWAWDWEAVPMEHAPRIQGADTRRVSVSLFALGTHKLRLVGRYAQTDEVFLTARLTFEVRAAGELEFVLSWTSPGSREIGVGEAGSDLDLQVLLPGGCWRDRPFLVGSAPDGGTWGERHGRAVHLGDSTEPRTPEVVRFPAVVTDSQYRVGVLVYREEVAGPTNARLRVLYRGELVGEFWAEALVQGEHWFVGTWDAAARTFRVEDQRTSSLGYAHDLCVIAGLP